MESEELGGDLPATLSRTRYLLLIQRPPLASAEEELNIHLRILTVSAAFAEKGHETDMFMP